MAALERRLFDELRTLRGVLAQGVAPFMVFSDTALAHMAEARPTSLDTLARIEGVNRTRADKYGPRTVAAIAAFAREHTLATDVGLTDPAPAVRVIVLLCVFV